MLLRLVLIFALIFFATSLNIHRSREKHPVVLVPGFGASRAYARPKFEKGQKFKPVWLNLKEFFNLKELTRKFRLFYDIQTHEVVDNQEFEVRFPGWGDTVSIEYLDRLQGKFGKYFESIARTLRRDPYFKSNKTLRGAPYDFRRAPKHNPGFLSKLQNLIESTYYKNKRRRVVIIGHSMGTLYTYWFLSKQTDSWKQKFIEAFISIGGPYGGSVKATRTVASGENVGVFFVSGLGLRELQRSMTALPFMQPQAKFWPPEEPIVITPTRNYTVNELKDLFYDIGYPEGYDMMRTTMMDFTQRPTGVDKIYCAYGVKTKTPAQVLYSPPDEERGPFPDQTPQTIFGDGDGTVNRQSLEICSQWPNVQTLRVPGAKHRNVMETPQLQDLIMKVTGAVPKRK